jgi:hypothetical protein
LPVDKFDDIICVKAGTALTNIFKSIKLIAGGKLTLKFSKESKILALKLNNIRKAQGIKGVVLYLKASSVLLQQALSQYRIKDCSSIGPRISRNGTGIPRIICRDHRLIMLNRSPGCYLLMRYYLSVFYIYRLLKYPGKVKLETITNPGKYFNMGKYENYIELFLSKFCRKDHLNNPLFYLQDKVRIFPIFRSSPFTSVVTYNPFILINKSKNPKVRETQL